MIFNCVLKLLILKMVYPIVKNVILFLNFDDYTFTGNPEVIIFNVKYVASSLQKILNQNSLKREFSLNCPV